MKRPTDAGWVRKTVAKMRKAIPGIALRTTFMVGYPGETEEEFKTLLDFAEEIRFDRVGVFKYSFERGTTSEPLGDPIPPELKEERYRSLMEKQQQISLERNKEFGGRRLNVLIEGESKGVCIGRSYRDAPEVDGLVIVEGKAKVGEIVPIKITSASAYDLRGAAIEST
jgi:ribosomal protein S12 methylthiotransferase